MTATTPTVIEILTAILSRNPDNEALACALTDARMESGTKPLTAKKETNRVIRAAVAAGLLAQATALATAETAKGGRVRSAVRSAAGVGGTKAEIVVVAGDASPTASGEEGHHVFRNGGGLVRNAGAAIRAGYKVDYVASTLRVTVGAGWVLRNR